MTPAVTRPEASGVEPETVLLLQREVLTRSALAHYLRGCGYRVLEANSTDEALKILEQSSQSIRAVLSDAENGFRVSAWVRANRPKIKVVLAATLDRAAEAAGALCDAGPHAKRPYHTQLLVQQIKASLARNEE